MIGIDPRFIEVWDNKVKQEITFFRSTDDPYAAAFVCDTSGSMKERVAALRSAVREFTQYSHPQDQYTLVGFNSKVDILGTDITPEDLINRMALLLPQKQTALYDAVQAGISSLATSRYSRRALILISDGQDNSSRTTLNALKSQLSEAAIRLFVVDVSGAPDFSATPFQNRNNSAEEATILFRMGQQASLQQQGKEILATLTRLGGGNLYDGTSDHQIRQAAINIALEMRRSFSIGFVPTEENMSGKRKWHKLQLKFTGKPQLIFNHRPGYWQ